MIGRRNEREELLQLIGEVRHGRGTVVLITGEAGMGKTRLAEETLADCELNIYTAKIIEGVSPPYAPLITILRNYLRHSDTRTIDCGNLTPFLSHLLPELGQIKDPPDAETLTETLLAALKTLVQNRSTVMFLDDLHWADNATLDMLPVLAEKLADLPLLLLGTYRSDEVPRGHRLRRMRHELRRRRILKEIVLSPLNREETRELIEHSLGQTPGSSLVNLIREKTLGVPLFIIELSNVLSTGGRLVRTESGLILPEGEGLPVPESIRDAVILRLDGLSEQARTLLEVAATAGWEFDFELVSGIAGNDDAMEELIHRQWISESSPGRGRFRHSLVREAIYHEIFWSRRRQLHRSIAEYLQSAGRSPEQIAEHWLAAREYGKARSALLQYAEHSCRLYAYQDASRAIYKALEHWHEGDNEELRLQTLERLSQCAQLNGQLNDASLALKELAESNIIKNNPLRYAEIQRAQATVSGLLGLTERYLASRLAAAEAFERAGNPGEASIELLSATVKHFELNNTTTAFELCEQALQQAGEAGRKDYQIRLLALRGQMLALTGHSDEGIAAIQDSLSDALEHNLPEAASYAYKRLADTLVAASDYSGARAAYDKAYRYCLSHGDHTQAQFCLGCMAYVLFRIGDWKQCSDICQEVTGRPDTPESPLAVAHCVFGFYHGYRGALRVARKHLLKSMHLARKNQIDGVIMGCLEGMALLDEYEGNDASASEFYLQLLHMREQTGDVIDALPGLCSGVTFFSISGMEKQALLCTKALTEMARDSGSNESLAILAYALGEMAMLHNEPKEAVRQFEQAVTLFEKLHIPLEWLKAEWRLGVAFYTDSRPKEAAAHLVNAYQAAKNLGCRPLASRIAGELDALEIPAEVQRNPGAATRSSHGGLTFRQTEVLRLISMGLTNKEIAQKLFLSPRTVEMHVAHLLNRLNCRSRLEAVRKSETMKLLD